MKLEEWAEFYLHDILKSDKEDMNFILRIPGSRGRPSGT